MRKVLETCQPSKLNKNRKCPEFTALQKSGSGQHFTAAKKIDIT